MKVQDALNKLGENKLSESINWEFLAPLFSRHLAARGGEVYFANHSLGRPLDQTADDVAEGLAAWYDRMDDAWGPWIDEIGRFRAAIARLISADSGDAIVPKSSVGQGLRAVLNALPDRADGRPHRVLATRNEFDSVDFILKAYQDRGRISVDWVAARPGDAVSLIHTEDLLSALAGGPDLVVVSKVFFGTGQVLGGIDKLIAAAHELGALVYVDAYHAAGVVPNVMGDADFMGGGSYKYTRGGPGACWLAIAKRHRESDTLRTLDTGWFAKKDPFAFERAETAIREPGGDGWMESTPSVLPLYQARAGLELTLGLGVERIREYGLAQNCKLISAFADRGLPVFQPTDPSEFGGYVLLSVPDASEVAKELKTLGVNADARGGAVRFGPDLLTTEAEVEQAADAAKQVLA